MVGIFEPSAQPNGIGFGRRLLGAAGLFLAFSLSAPTAHADVVLNLQDARKAPLPGVHCAQEGGPSGVSDAAGRIVLKNPLSGILGGGGRSGAAGEGALTAVPLLPGERARVTVRDLRGREVFVGTVVPGGRLPFPRRDPGVYLAEIRAPRLAVTGRLANLDGRLVFTGVPAGGASAPGSLAKAARSAAEGVPELAPIVCRKTGYVTQVYKAADGSVLTVDFSTPKVVPLFDAATSLEPEVHYDRGDAIVTQWGDRARDRHAREEQFQSYDHYLTFYWEHRTARMILVDRVAKGGSTIEMSWVTEWKLKGPPEEQEQPEFRIWYIGKGTVANYFDNAGPNLKREGPGTYDLEHRKVGEQGTQYKYTYTIKEHRTLSGERKDLAVGQLMEIEASQFLSKPPQGRENYYGTTFLYEVGRGGLVPWHTVGSFEDQSSEREDSRKLPEKAWLGGRTTLPYQYSDEPDNHFLQMATNISGLNAQPFVRGRRVLHTSFLDGAHDEPDNPAWSEQAGKAGPRYINVTCNACHTRNGRGLAMEAGKPLYRTVVKVGDAEGNPHPKLGAVLQPQSTAGEAEGTMALAAWNEENGLRRPAYRFTGPAPTHFSVRATPPLVGLGLLEAVPETTLQGLEDPDDLDGDGISGRLNIVPDPKSGQPRAGRFGWKAGKASLTHQVAAALNTDMGVMTSVLPRPDCGAEQAGCGAAGAELADGDLDHLVTYIALLGVRARRDLADPAALRGEELFASLGCAACHVPTLRTGPHHPKAELRDQVIHPYTDLLLHDMGPGLADNLGEGRATGSEWRTPPLWGLGLQACVTGGVEGPFQKQTCVPHHTYLHDGRARSVEEAILWHGGEGEKSRERYQALGAADKAALLKFLNSL